MWIQHDRIPPHIKICLRGYLNTVFPNGRIGQTCRWEWRAKSSDLTPFDFSSHFKKQGLPNKPYKHDLKDIITVEMQAITRQMFGYVSNEFLYYTGLLLSRKKERAHFEHLNVTV